MAEKRLCPRVSLSSIVDYSSAINARARNVSETGLGILSRRNFKTGTPLFLTISLPGSGLLKVIGQIMWSTDIKSELYLNGLKFISLKEEYKKKLKKYVNKMINNGHERRRTPRSVLDILINFRMKGRACVKNLNLDGICTITSRALEEGKIILLSISLPDEHLINAYGRVVWCREMNPNVFETGIEFWDLKKEDQDILSDFVNSTETKKEEKTIKS